MKTAQQYAKIIVSMIKRRNLRKIKKAKENGDVGEVLEKEITLARNEYLYFCYLHSPDAFGKNYFNKEIINQLFQ